MARQRGAGLSRESHAFSLNGGDFSSATVRAQDFSCEFVSLLRRRGFGVACGNVSTPGAPRYLLIVAAPAMHVASSCEPDPPEQPIAPKAFVGRRIIAAMRALCSAIAIPASMAPPIRPNATRLAPESTTATFVAQPCCSHLEN
jgi:hypothetical protein